MCCYLLYEKWWKPCFLYLLDNREAFPGAYGKLNSPGEKLKGTHHIWIHMNLMISPVRIHGKGFENDGNMFLLWLWCYLLYEKWWKPCFLYLLDNREAFLGAYGMLSSPREKLKGTYRIWIHMNVMISLVRIFGKSFEILETFFVMNVTLPSLRKMI